MVAEELAREFPQHISNWHMSFSEIKMPGTLFFPKLIEAKQLTDQMVVRKSRSCTNSPEDWRKLLSESGVPG